MKNDNYTLMCDFYELTMCNGYFVQGLKDKICYFDYFFRTVPDNGGFAISCGLEQVIEYIRNLHFSEEDIRYWESKKSFAPEFLEISEGLSGSPATSGRFRKGRSCSE